MGRVSASDAPIRTRTEKRCPGCNTTRPIADFYPSKHSWDGRTVYCRDCARDMVKRHPKRSVYRRKYRAAKYGLSLEQLDELELRAAGCCEICGLEVDYQLCIDHDHRTDQVRGLLCHSCNKALGALEDHLFEALIYLARAAGQRGVAYDGHYESGVWSGDYLDNLRSAA